MEKLDVHLKKDLKEGGEKQIKEFILKERLIGKEKISGEYEKSKEELKIIETINFLILNEIKKMDVSPKETLSSERVHLVSENIFNQCHPGQQNQVGSYTTETNSILINRDQLKQKLLLFSTILHEVLHYYSFNSFVVSIDSNEVGPYRTGYSLQNFSENINNHEHFRGLTEAVIDKMVQEIIENNKVFLISQKIVSLGEFKKKNDILCYKEEVKVLELVINKITEIKQKSYKEVWIKFKRGLFTGEMMYLRDVDNVFGTGSLRVLSAMLSEGSTKNIDSEQLIYLFDKFFKEEDKEIRNNLARKILSERERLRYFERINKEKIK
ncbi:MAG: hypothetical protein WC822_04125 [Candidatus Paceibacterota bacterium]|jgi:hypothetical protein